MAKAFPFKTATLYKVKKNFQVHNSDAFVEGELLFYVKSEYNHFDGIEICTFRDKQSTKFLIWHLPDHELENWNEYLEVYKG